MNINFGNNAALKACTPQTLQQDARYLQENAQTNLNAQPLAPGVPERLENTRYVVEKLVQALEVSNERFERLERACVAQGMDLMA